MKTDFGHKLEMTPRPLQPPDSHHLRAAEGWLELGDPAEANQELQRLSLTGRFHPLALLTRWDIYAQLEHWEFAYTIAQGLVAMLPEEPVGWINRAFALHRLQRTREAWDKLRPAADKFPNNLTISYNLACYACQLGSFDEASRWLKKAMKLADPNKVQLVALDDPDLKPLWEVNPNS